MNTSFTKQQRSELRMLISQSIDGAISRDSIGRMEQILESGPEARAYYRDYLSVYCDLSNLIGCSQAEPELSDGTDTGIKDPRFWEMLMEQENSAPAITLPEPLPERIQYVPPEKVHYTLNKNAVRTLIISSAAIFLIGVFLYITTPVPKVTIGRLTRTVNAQWADATGVIETGCDFYSGPMKLTKGLAEITFDNGAVVIVEGPCEFDLESDRQLFLRSGAIVANVESSVEKRFVVRTPNASVVDYGTEFGVDVDVDGRTKTHVFQGRVELRQGNDPLKYEKTLRLEAGQGGQANNQGVLLKQKLDARRFVRQQQFDTQVLAGKGSGYHRWKAYNYQMHRDPSLVAHYTFEKKDGADNALVNVSDNSQIPNGVLGGDQFDAPEWAQGRWPQKTALHFDNQANQAVWLKADPALSLTGPMTVASWVKSDFIPGETKRYLGHVISSRSDDAVNFSLSFATARGQEPARKPKIQTWFFRRAEGTAQIKSHAEDEGVVMDTQSWHLVCVTHDLKTVRFYVDGVLASTREYNYVPQSIVADAFIGNSVFGSARRKFDGLIGEIAIFDRALSDSEISRMYQAGKE